jgi:hypothetical protein
VSIAALDPDPDTTGLPLEIAVDEVFGFTVSARCRVSAAPIDFRRRQGALVQRLRSLTPATVVAPESYDDQPTDDRTEPEVQLRTWSDRSVGVTRYPVGLVRFVVPCEEERSGWSLGHRVVTFYRDGTAVVRASWTRSAGAPEDVAGLVRDLGTRQVSSDRATLLVAELDDLLLRAMREESLDCTSLGTVAVVGRHRLVRVGAHPTPALIESARSDVAIVGSHEDFTDLSARDDLFLHAGNGISLEIGPDAIDQPSRLMGALTEYEHWISVACRSDDELAEEFRTLSLLTAPSEGPVGTTWERAQLAVFDHQDVLNAMSPEHVAVWRGYLSTWRLADLEDEIRLKLDAVRDRDRELRESLANQIATRTEQTITFLTTLTLVSIVTGVATYLINEPRPGPWWRAALVLLTVVAATAIYQRSHYPGRVRAAVEQLLRRRTGRG